MKPKPIYCRYNGAIYLALIAAGYKILQQCGEYVSLVKEIK